MTSSLNLTVNGAVPVSMLTAVVRELVSLGLLLFTRLKTPPKAGAASILISKHCSKSLPSTLTQTV
jgi:hypothetical protein